MATQEDKIHMGDIGTVFEVTVVEKINGVNSPVNVSSASVKTVVFKKPSGAVDSQTALFTTDGTDGKIQYVSVADDLDQRGDWQLQGYVELTAWEGYTDIGSFEVEPNLN